MHLLEQFSESKLAGRDNEDGLVVTPDFAAVIDGSTSKLAAADAPVPSTGRRAMLAVSQAVRHLPREADMPTALHRLTDALREAYPDEAARQAALRYAPRRYTCSAVVYSASRREVWMMGDCACRFDGHTHIRPKAVDTILTRIRGEILHYLLRHGHTVEDLQRSDPGRAFILDALRDQTFFQNDPTPGHPYSYPVLDGTPVDPDRITVLPVGAATTLILASDGYPVLHDTWAETEADLQRRLRADPLCIDTLPATKCLAAGARSFDDRTYLKLLI